jgi:hypothetical protein
MSTVIKPGKLNSSSSSANEVIGEARRILRREAGGVRYDPRTSLTLPPLTGIRYGLESPSPTSRFGHLGRPNVGRGSFGKGSPYVCLTFLSSAVAKSRIARQLGRSRMHRASRWHTARALPRLLHESEIENLARWNFFGSAAESFLGELDGAFHPVFIHRSID